MLMWMLVMIGVLCMLLGVFPLFNTIPGVDLVSQLFSVALIAMLGFMWWTILPQADEVAVG